MSVPVRKMVLIIDPMAFGRARVECFLESWARNENVVLLSLSPDQAHAKLIESNCDMLIYNAGGARPSTHEILTEIQVLHTLRPAAALVILSDDTSQVSIVAAMNAGAQGYLNNSMAPGLALQALSFVLHGGTYFPPAAILAGQTASNTLIAAPPHLDFPEATSQGHQPSDLPQRQSSGAGDSFLQQQGSLLDETAARVQPYDISALTRCAPASKPEFTERQQAVLSCLCRGDPNKVIGRRLGMTETTVKVHVREIMRKLGVYNRTQVAIAASRTDINSDSVVKVSSQEIPRIVRSPGTSLS